MKRLVYILILALLFHTMPALAGDIPWNSLSPQEQQTLQRLQGRWDQLPTQRQQKLRAGAKRWSTLEPAQKEKLRQRREWFRSLPPDERERLKQRWREMTPEQRQSYLQKQIR